MMSNNAFQIPSETTAKPRAIAPNLTLEWLHDEQVASFVLSSLSKQNVDAYVDTVIDLLKTYPEDRIFLILLDVTHINRLNAYFKNRLEDINAVLHETGRENRAAIVIPRGLAASLFLLFSHTFVPSLPSSTVCSLFQEQDKALQWLVEALD